MAISHAYRLRRRTPRRTGLARAQSRTGLALVSPTLIVTLTLVVVPVLWTLVLSMQRVPLSGLRHVGLLHAHYTLRNFRLVLGSSEFWQSIKTTLIYTIFGTGGSIVLGLAAALLVRDKFRGSALVRGAMLLPWVAPIVAVAFAWSIMLNPQFGIVNGLGQKYLGWSSAIPFLSEQRGQISLLGTHVTVPTALLVIIAFESWRYFPFAFLFILARLHGLPRELDEAAKVDGATPLQRFRYITLPQLSGVIALLALLRFIFNFNKFDDIYLLTGGGAGTQVIGIQVYNYLTARNDVGGSAAVSVVMAAVMTVALIVYLRFFARREEVQ